MRAIRLQLVNTPDIELWPAPLLRARGSRDARALARASRVLRRKTDGRYLAADLDAGLLPLVVRLAQEPGIDAALDALDGERLLPRGCRREPDLPLESMRQHLHALGLDQSYGERSGLALVAEPARLEFAGRDRFRRPLWLLAPTARAWRRLLLAASGDEIALDAISGYRSHAYQLGIFQRKLARGLSVPEILAVNAAPGYSEHHSGRALDIGTPGEAPAEESFENTAAYAWLQERAGGFGFRLSYPRHNPHGIVYEPWHWCWHPPAPASPASASPAP